MTDDYRERALARATYEFLPEDRVFFAGIPGFYGAWATGDTLEECRHELAAVLEDWIELGRVLGHGPPPEV